MQTIEEYEKQEIAVTEVNPICDSCGGTVSASYQAVKDNQSLNFCGHHIRRHAEKLKDDGFKIVPDDFSFQSQQTLESQAE